MLVQPPKKTQRGNDHTQPKGKRLPEVKLAQSFHSGHPASRQSAASQSQWGRQGQQGTRTTASAPGPLAACWAPKLLPGGSVTGQALLRPPPEGPSHGKNQLQAIGGLRAFIPHHLPPPPPPLPHPLPFPALPWPWRGCKLGGPEASPRAPVQGADSVLLGFNVGQRAGARCDHFLAP